jgi:late competence protein required for DNA uptake (superfamily II DNA/RNA helicase)
MPRGRDEWRMRMAKDRISVKFKCKKCDVSPHVEDENDDSSKVYCRECGNAFGTYGEVKAKALKLARDQAQNMLRDAFEGRKCFKLK